MGKRGEERGITREGERERAGEGGQGERRGKSAGEREEKFSSSFPLSARMPAGEREGRWGREGIVRERERENRCPA